MTTNLDDGIVVVGVRKDVGSMSVRALKETLGNDAMAGLHMVVDDRGRQWKDDVLAITEERFERHLAKEIGELRIDMTKEFASLRVGMAKEFTNVLKWSFLFWIGQFATVSAMVAFLLSTIGAR